MVDSRARAAGPPVALPETVGYALKRLLLGRPLVTRKLSGERLSKPVALGVLSPDCISSSAYGVEEMLIELLPYAGLAAFTIVLPITGVILVILVLMTLCYRQVVQIYTTAGGSYVVARENFGPKVAQVAAVALLIDYVVTVAVQAAAGTVAVASAVPALGPYSLEITVGIVLVICYGNLRGIREAGKAFAAPTYLFIAAIGSVIVVGVIRELAGTLGTYHPEQTPGVYPVHHGSGLVAGATILVLLRSFANGGSSLTGLEAISNGVSAFRPPTGVNARKVLGVMAATLGFLLAGVAWLAHVTHAAPYLSGYPSVISQEARIVFGAGPVGHVLYLAVQAASALILYTGANTSFNGFPFLASFVAEDRFLPRQLTKRGHRLVFSNGIIVLAVASVVLLVVTGGQVNALVPFYAIGVFTGFTMAGLGMARYHTRNRHPGWRRKALLTGTGGVMSAAVVLVFAIAKFTEGAWVAVVVFPILVWVLMRLNREYRLESAILNHISKRAVAAPKYGRHQVLVLVNAIDLAAVEAIRYARSLNPSGLRAVHFVIDAQHAKWLEDRYDRVGVTIPLDLIDCPDRRITRSVTKLVTRTLASTPDTGVTVLIPRRSYAPLLGRVLHDRTADRLARAVSRIPGAAATVFPFDVQAEIRRRYPRLPEERATRTIERWRGRLELADQVAEARDEAVPAGRGTSAITAVHAGQVATIEGRVAELVATDRPGRPRLVLSVVDGTGTITVQLTRPAGNVPEPGQTILATGRVSDSGDDRPGPVMIDPAWRVVGTET